MAILSVIHDDGGHKCGGCNWETTTFYTVDGNTELFGPDDDPEEGPNGLCSGCMCEMLLGGEVHVPGEATTLVRFTIDDAKTIMGREPTQNEVRVMVKALEHSSMSEVFGDVVHSVMSHDD